MKQYKTVYYSAYFSDSNIDGFEDEINELAKEGWEVKFSNIAINPKSADGTTSAKIAAYALLDREIKK